jgi:toluene monooxygenase system protein E
MLGAKRRMPTEYELTSSRLHYHYPRNFELSNENPVSLWYFEHREGSPVQALDWETFADPRRTTYTTYNDTQHAKETVVDGLLREIDEREYDQTLAPDWVDFLHHWYGPLRYPAHGLQMMSAYVAQMAPASRITNCAAFQAGDEMRRLQRIAYRTAQLAAHRPGRDPHQHQRFWEEAAEFQPLRELIERALVTYDWGEAFVALNLVIKPHLDHLINSEWAGGLAAAHGDPILGAIHFSLDEDARWHREWAERLVQVAISDTPTNAEIIDTWVDRWRPRTVTAVEALAGAAGQAAPTVVA